MRDQKALKLVTAQVAQRVKLRLRLHPLGHGLQLQAARHLDDGGGDRQVMPLTGDFTDKTAVDLQLVDRVALQVAQ